MNIISLIREILKSRGIIWDLAKADFKKRFVGSYFGIAWMFVQPVVTVLIYFLIFQMGFKSEPPVPGVPYVVWLVPGIVPWFFFAETINLGTAVLSEYNYLVKKVGDFMPYSAWNLCCNNDNNDIGIWKTADDKLDWRSILQFLPVNICIGNNIYNLCHKCIL